MSALVENVASVASMAVNRRSMSSADKSAVIDFPEIPFLFGSGPVMASGHPFALPARCWNPPPSPSNRLRLSFGHYRTKALILAYMNAPAAGHTETPTGGVNPMRVVEDPSTAKRSKTSPFEPDLGKLDVGNLIRD